MDAFDFQGIKQNSTGVIANENTEADALSGRKAATLLSFKMRDWFSTVKLLNILRKAYLKSNFDKSIANNLFCTHGFYGYV